MNLFATELPELLQRDLAELPDSPGVYLMKSVQEHIIYIGKAKNLQRRVRSYFSGSKDLKTEMLRRKIARISVMLCASDYEALILENNLIKKHKPRYNINLKDDKTYPLACISNEDFPQIYKTRYMSPHGNGGQYFGPFPNGMQLEASLQLINDLFPLRRCKGRLRKRQNPCLYYHLKQCLGPCIGAVSKEQYREHVHKAKHILEGNSKTLQRSLEKEMRSAATELRFEEAARLRDQIESLKGLKQDQSAELQERPEVTRDYLAILQLEEHYFFTILMLRSGKLSGYQHFNSRYLLVHDQEAQTFDTANATELENSLLHKAQRNKEQQETVRTALVEFLCQYYLEAGRELPSELYLPVLSNNTNPDHTVSVEQQQQADQEELALFLQLLQTQRGETLTIRSQFKENLSPNDRLLLLRARENAIREQQLWLRYQGRSLMLEELMQALELSQLPEHIEGFDISHMGGKETVASLIVFRNGKPAKSEYRSFNILCSEGSPNDVASIQEAVARRYTRLLNEQSALPNLILIDGGQGQVNGAAHVLRSLELDLPLIGLAKKEELVFFPCIPKELESAQTHKDRYSKRRAPLRLPHDHPGLKLLQQVRDETHRLAHEKNRKRYEKRFSASLLENVPGIGNTRSKKLLLHFGSIEKIAEAMPEELMQAGSLSRELAETLIAYLVHRR